MSSGSELQPTGAFGTEEGIGRGVGGSGGAGRHSQGVQRRSTHRRAAGLNKQEEKQQILCVDSRRPLHPHPCKLRSPPSRTPRGETVKAPTASCVHFVFIISFQVPTWHN